MGSLLLLVVCLLAGVLLQRVPAVPANAAQALNQFVIHISLPALALYFIPELRFDATLLYPVAVGWLVFLGSMLFFLMLQRIFGWSRKLTGCLIVVAGLGNTSFIGFPVIEALYGRSGLITAVLVDQSTFVVLATLGVGISAWYAQGGTTARELLLKIVRFPPFSPSSSRCSWPCWASTSALTSRTCSGASVPPSAPWRWSPWACN